MAYAYELQQLLLLRDSVAPNLERRSTEPTGAASSSGSAPGDVDMVCGEAGTGGEKRERTRKTKIKGLPRMLAEAEATLEARVADLQVRSERALTHPATC